nr:unnamed protein product [Spirometra erinaceieuropaei]
MWRFTSLAVVIIAAIGPYLYPGSNKYTGEVWRSFSSGIATLSDRLVSLGHAFMEKVYHACGWRVGDFNLNEETNLPECMRQPMDVDQLRPYIHLSLLGHVFDVSANSKVYGPKGVYTGMTGRDATRLIFSNKLLPGSSGSSEENIVKGFALDGLSSTQLAELGDWMKFYSRKYRCVGYIPGPYFSPMGEASDYLKQLVGLWNRRDFAHADLADLFPPCSSFFDGKSLTLRCNSERGVGDADSGVMYPRQLLEPEKATVRCACIPAEHLTHPRVRQYPGCPSTAIQCQLEVEDAESVWTGGILPIEAA